MHLFCNVYLALACLIWSCLAPSIYTMDAPPPAAKKSDWVTIRTDPAEPLKFTLKFSDNVEAEIQFSDEETKTKFEQRVSFIQTTSDIASLKAFTLLSSSLGAFNYEISTDIFRKSNLIEVGILGLTTKINNAPLETKATTVIKLPDEVGEISVNIIKYDGCENSCNIKFNLYEKNIQILNTQVVEKHNNRLFCKFEVNPKLNNFSNELLGE